MRHVLSLLLGLVLAPAIWICSALGAAQVTQVFILLRPASDRLGPTLLGVALLAVAGLALGVLLGTRLSPVGPAVGGLLFLAAGGVHLFDPKILVDLAPGLGVASPVDWVTPAGFGWSWLIGFALLVPLAVPSRWRRSSGGTAPAAAGGTAGGTTGGATPAPPPMVRGGEEFAPGQPPGYPPGGVYPPASEVSTPGPPFAGPPSAPTTPGGFPTYGQGGGIAGERPHGPSGPSGRFGEPASRPGEPPRRGTPSGTRHPASPEPVSWFDRPDNDPPGPASGGPPPWPDPTRRAEPRRPWEEGDDPESTQRLQ